jgi:hypothetical protein
VMQQIITGIQSAALNNLPDGANQYQSYFNLLVADKILLGWITPPAVPSTIGKEDMWLVDVAHMPGDVLRLGTGTAFWVNQTDMAVCNAPAVQSPDKKSCVCPTGYRLNASKTTDFSQEGNPNVITYQCLGEAKAGDDAGDGYFWASAESQMKCVGKAQRNGPGCNCPFPYPMWYHPETFLKQVGSDEVLRNSMRVTRRQVDCVEQPSELLRLGNDAKTQWATLTRSDEWNNGANKVDQAPDENVC